MIIRCLVGISQTSLLKVFSVKGGGANKCFGINESMTLHTIPLELDISLLYIIFFYIYFSFFFSRFLEISQRKTFHLLQLSFFFQHFVFSFYSLSPSRSFCLSVSLALSASSTFQLLWLQVEIKVFLLFCSFCLVILGSVIA